MPTLKLSENIDQLQFKESVTPVVFPVANGWYIYIKSDGNLYKMDEAGTESLVGGAGSLANIVEDVTPQLGAQLDVNGFGLGDGTLDLLTFTEVGSSVNNLDIANAITATNPVVGVAGSDTDIGITFTPKGAGELVFSSPVNVIQTSAPSVVTDKLYNVSGNLYWNGTDISTPGSAPVDSVFGRTGAVAAVSGDYTASEITNVAAGSIIATDVQAAIDELDAEKQAAGDFLSASADDTMVGTLTINAPADKQLVLERLTDDPADLHIKAGDTANQRRYIRWKDKDDADGILFGVNSSHVVIMYDSFSNAPVHRLWFEPDNGTFGSGNSYINSSLGSTVRIGYHDTDVVGNVLEVWSGEATPLRQHRFDAGYAHYTAGVASNTTINSSGQMSVKQILNTGYALTAGWSPTHTSGGGGGIYSQAVYNPSGVSTGGMYGAFFQPTSNSGNNNAFSYLAGVGLVAIHQGGGLATTLHGGQFVARSSGSGGVTTSYGGHFTAENTGSGTVTTAHGVYIGSTVNSGGGTVTGNYGMRILDQTTGGFNYALRTGLGVVAFGDKVGIGTISPVAQLEVSQSDPSSAIPSLKVTQTDLDQKAITTDGTILASIVSPQAGNTVGHDVTIRPSTLNDIMAMRAKIDAVVNNTATNNSAPTGLNAIVQSRNGATITNGYAINALGTVGADANSVITNLKTIRINKPSISGAGSKVTNVYGLYVEDIDNGTTLNYAIYTNAGYNYFGDRVGLSVASPAAQLDISQSSGTAAIVALKTTQADIDVYDASFEGGTGINLTTGGYFIAGANINTAGTLSNVAYKNAANVFTAIQEVDVSSATALLVENAGNNTFVVDTTAGQITVSRKTAVTNSIQDLFFPNAVCTGTAAIGFGSAIQFKMSSATVAGRKGAIIGSLWNDATDVSRSADFIIGVVDNASEDYDEAVRVKSTGEVGIGTDTPDSRLDIGAGALTFSEMTAPGAPAANGAVLYIDDTGGKTQLMVRFATGAAIQLAVEP